VRCRVEPPPDPENWEQDPDVLDTWFSSWLWPFATMGWPESTPTLKKFYPTTDLVTGPDIIFFWVARMIMAGYEYLGEKPFAASISPASSATNRAAKCPRASATRPIRSISSPNTAPMPCASASCAPRRSARTSSSTKTTSSSAATSATNSGTPAASANSRAAAPKAEIDPPCSPSMTNGSS
jgi:hypothetical protein